MKLKTNLKKIIAAFILIMIISSAFIGNFNSVYGRVNEYYSTGETSGSIDVDQATEDATVLTAVAHFIYAIAGFVENIVSKIIGSITGSEIFPWADRVIFNTIEFLDVNFLSPSNGSLFRDLSGDPTLFGKIIGNLYYTVFTLAVAFFGVVVGIMALRLAISSIASEKAKYKQAITNWLLALILIFIAHYLISFIFFVNEKMVGVASSILKEQINDVDFSIDTENWTDTQCENMIKLFLESSLAGGTEEFFHKSYPEDYGITKVSSYDRNIHFSIEMNDDDSNGAINSDDDAVRIVKYTGDVPNDYENDSGLQSELYRYTCKLLTSRAYIGSNDFYDYETHNGFQNFLNGWKAFFGESDNGIIAMNIFHDATYLLALEKAGNNKLSENDFIANYVTQLYEYNSSKDMSIDEIKNILSSNGNLVEISLSTSMSYLVSRATRLYSVYNNSIAITNTATENKDVLTSMSAFFRNSVYTFKYDENGEIASSTATQFQAIPAILYSIFVIQSIMYFIAYMKRFFYIVILALFAPIVIIYDFLMKTAMG